MPEHTNNTCPLCSSDGGTLICRTAHLRVVFAHEASYPAFVRVIWNDHVKEMSDLSAVHQTLLMHAVFAIEAQMRRVFEPAKINLASFGNVVPHVHWHLVPRWADDAHWPQPTWSTRQREGTAHGAEKLQALAGAIRAALPGLENQGTFTA
jgi:diadenosine tetraphosphate (Ap4A) HIT family hydrolase